MQLNCETIIAMFNTILLVCCVCASSAQSFSASSYALPCYSYVNLCDDIISVKLTGFG